MKKATSKELNQAMIFFREYLFVSRPRLINKIFIKIRLLKNIGADGWCIVHDADKGRDFTIKIHSEMNYKRTILTLAHEMVHVWQYAIGNFKVYESGAYRFSGKKYSFDTEYTERPWEIEAFEMEQELYKAWCARKRKKKSS